MTIVACPHGCGGAVNTAYEDACGSCRRGLNETEVVIPEDAPYVTFTPVARRASWCWEWHGPAAHRMRCRLPAGHEGAHDCREDRQPGELSISTDGALVGGCESSRCVQPNEENSQ